MGTKLAVPLKPGTHKVGPKDGSIKVMTGRDGPAAQMGHDLVLEVTRWEATVTISDDSAVEFSADPASFEVLAATGGVKPLSSKDKAQIKTYIVSKVLGSSPIRFRSSAATLDGATLTVVGTLNIAGGSRSVTVPLTVAEDGTIRGRVTIVQSDFGIKPFSIMMGALKVADPVEVQIETKLPTG